ncbi:MAG: autotransporter-associated beta strand repeat-containing protein, partial [Tepidisphaeraceae bacterium]
MDLSSWQGDVSQATWNLIEDTKKFGFVRASRGATFGPIVPVGENDGDPYNRFDDRFFVQNITRGTAAGMLMGSYHFNRADIAGNTGADEANHYMETGTGQPAGHPPQYAGNFMRPGYLLPVFDLEAGNTAHTQASLTAWSNEFLQTIYDAKGFYPIVYTSSSYNNDEVSASVAWNTVDTGPGPHSGLKTYQWLARPSGDIVNGEPGAATNYPNPYGQWDANFNTRTNSRDPAINPWSFWQNGTFVIPGGVNGSGDKNAAHGNMEFVRDFLVPALWTNAGSGDWGTMSNWNSDNPLYNVGNAGFGPQGRLPNSMDWVELRNTGGGTVTLSSTTVAIRKLTVTQPLNMTGGSLSVSYVPGSGGRDDIPSEFEGAVTISGAAAYSAHTTQVTGGGGTFNVNGGTLTFTNINLASHASNSGKIVMGGAATFAQTGGAGTSTIRSTGTLAQAGSITLSAGDRTFNVNNGSASLDLNVRAAITGAGRLVKGGLGTMQLAASNSYSGGTTVSGGTLQLTNDNRLGAVPGVAQANNLILNGGTLRTGSEINSASLSNAGSGYTGFPTLTINGGGADVLAASANVLASVNAIGVSAGGSNYVNQVSAPTAGSAGTFVDIVGGGGTGAAGFATVVGGIVTGVTITNQGIGYTSIPTIHISSTITGGLGGSGAAAAVSGITLQSIAMNDPGFDYNAPTITLSGGGGSGAAAAATGTPNWFTSATRGLELGAGGGTLFQTAGHTLTWAGAISGSGPLAKSGAGTLELASDNTNTGQVSINAGTLSVSSNAKLGNAGNGVTINNGGTLATTATFSSARNYVLGSTIGGSSTISPAPGTTLTITTALTGTQLLSLGNTGTLELSAASVRPYSTLISQGTIRLLHGAGLGDGQTIVNGGTLELAGVACGQSLSLQSGTLRGTGNASYFGTIGALLSPATVTIATGASPSDILTIGDGVNDYTSGISAHTTLVSGSGTVSLPFSNNYAGAWQLNGGVVRLGHADSLGASASTVVVNNTATLELNGISFTRGLTLNNGSTLRGNAVTGTSGTIAVAGSANVTLATSSDPGDDFSIGDSANDLTGGNGSSIISAVGPGTIYLTNASNYIGQWRVNGGALVVQNNTGLGTGTSAVVVNAAELNLNGVTLNRNLTLNNGSTLRGTGPNTSNGTTTVASGAAITLATGPLATNTLNIGDAANDLAGGGGGSTINVAGSGQVTLLQSSNYTGNWTLSSGTLELGADDRLGNAANTVTLAGGTLRSSAAVTSPRALAVTTTGTFDSNGFDSTFGDVNGNGTLTKASAGKLTVNHVRSSGLTIDAGTVAVAAS